MVMLKNLLRQQMFFAVSGGILGVFLFFTQASAASCPRDEPCPACPACARCPEPAFECKKVPNYNAINDNYLPQPVLNDFSSFGM